METSNFKDFVKNNKEKIFFGELVFFLHDITKATKDFFEDPYNHEKYDINKNKEFFELFEEINFSYDDFENFKFYYSDKKKKKDKSYFISKNQSILSAIINHHKEEMSGSWGLIDYLLYSAFGGIDGIESLYGKGVTGSQKDLLKKQDKNNITIINPLFEIKSSNNIEYFDSLSKELFDGLYSLFKTYKEGKTTLKDLLVNFKSGYIKELFSKFLGETRYPLNDTTLYHHSFMTAALGKALLIRVLFEKKVLNEDYLLPIRNNLHRAKEHSQNQKYTTFRTLLITVPLDLIMNNMHKIPLINGYYSSLQFIYDELKDFIEYELPIGTEVYRDRVSVAYILPDFSNYQQTSHIDNEIDFIIKSKLSELIKEKFKALLPIRFEDLRFCDEDASLIEDNKLKKKYPLSYLLENRDKYIGFFKETDWINENTLKIEYIKCPQCNLHLMKKDDEYCDVCKSVYKYKKDTILHDKDFKEAILFEEVKDKRNYIACFHLKLNLKKFLDGSAFELYILNEEKKRGKTASPSRLMSLLESINDFFDKVYNNALQCLPETTRDKKSILEEFNLDNSDNIPENFKKFLTIYRDNMNFKFLVPAEKSLELLNLINNLYFDNFKQVADKLPIYTVVCYFKHKYPFYVVNEIQNKLLKIFEKNSEVEAIKKNNGEIIEFIKNNKIITKYKSVKLKPNDENSYFSKKFFVTNGKYNVMPSYWVNFYVDSVAKKSDYGKNSRRYLGLFEFDNLYPTIFDLEDVNNILEFFDKVQSESQINNFIELAFDKYQRFDDLYEHYLKLCLKNLKYKKSPTESELDFVAKSFTNGLFFEAYELYKFGKKKR